MAVDAPAPSGGGVPKRIIVILAGILVTVGVVMVLSSDNASKSLSETRTTELAWKWDWKALGCALGGGGCRDGGTGATTDYQYYCQHDSKMKSYFANCDTCVSAPICCDTKKADSWKRDWSSSKADSGGSHTSPSTGKWH